MAASQGNSTVPIKIKKGAPMATDRSGADRLLNNDIIPSWTRPPQHHPSGPWSVAARMEQRCHWCFADAAVTPRAVSYPCGHNICMRCHLALGPDKGCVVCQIKLKEMRGSSKALEEERRSHLEEQEEWRKKEIKLQGELKLHEETEGKLQREVSELKKGKKVLEEKLKGKQELEGKLQQEVAQLKKWRRVLEEEVKEKQEHHKTIEERLLNDIEILKLTIAKHVHDDEMTLKGKQELESKLQQEVTQMKKQRGLLQKELKEKQEHHKSIEERLLKQIETLKQTIAKHDDEMTLMEITMDEKDTKLEEMKLEYQDNLAQLTEQYVSELKEEVQKERNTQQNKMETMKQEVIELKEEVTSLREVKKAQEKEITHWQQENAKQKKAVQDEDLEGNMKELQLQVSAKEKEMQRLEEENRTIKDKLQRSMEDLTKCNEQVARLREAHTQHLVKRKEHKEEIMRLKEEMKCKEEELAAKVEEVTSVYDEKIKKRQKKEAELENDNARLIQKDIQQQNKLAAARASQEKVRSLVIEIDSRQKEIDGLEKEETKLKNRMTQLRRGTDNDLLKIFELVEEKTSQPQEPANPAPKKKKKGKGK